MSSTGKVKESDNEQALACFNAREIWLSKAFRSCLRAWFWSFSIGYEGIVDKANSIPFKAFSNSSSLSLLLNHPSLKILNGRLSHGLLSC